MPFPLNARDWLPDWFVCLNAVYFFIVPLLATRIPPTRHKSERATAKLFMIALAQGWWVFLFSTQTMDMPFIENDAELRFFLGRIGYLAVGHGVSVYILNGWVFSKFDLMRQVLEPLWKRIVQRWKFWLSLPLS